MSRVLTTYLFILIPWAVYRFYYHLTEPVDELVAKPIVFLLPVIWYSWRYEESNLTKLGLRVTNLFRDLYLGIGLGIVLALEGMLVNYVKYGELNFRPLPTAEGYGLLLFLVLSLATSASEEILGRGFLYNQMRYYLDDLGAVFLSSLLFLLLHLPIVYFVLQLTGATLGIYLASVFVLSVANCLLLRFTGSLVSPILVHAFWNMTIGLYI